MTDHLTKYTTEMYRFYARVGGLSSYVKAKEASIAQAAYAHGESLGIQHGLSDPTAAAIGRMEAERKECGLLSEYADLQAVECALAIISRLRCSGEMHRALERVYFLDADRPIEWGDIKGRVVAASLWMPASEPSIYRWLADARAIVAIERGLRLDDRHIARLRRLHL